MDIEEIAEKIRSDGYAIVENVTKINKIKFFIF